MRKPCVGDLICSNSISQFAGVELKIRAVLLGTVYARPKRGRHDIELTEDQFTYLQPEKITAAEKSQIIKKLVKPEFIQDIKSFGREQNALNRLIEKYNNRDFWMEFELGFQLRSINWLHGGGSEQMRIKYNSFSLDKNTSICDTKPITLREDKIGVDVTVSNKPKNLLDILKIETI